MSKLYFTYSAMNAGKSALLLQAAHNYRERGLRVMLWTSSHHADAPGDRNGRIVSRIGLNAEARVFSPTTSLRLEIQDACKTGQLDAVFLDEAQFLTRPQVLWASNRFSG
jgi:thymidine kinase